MADTSEPVVRDNPAQKRFEVLLDDEVAGFTTYQTVAGAVAFMHTEIDERFEGQGLGSTLVRRALNDVRDRGLDVLPYCPFVRAYIRRHREYVDLVPADMRHRFEL